MRSYNIKRTIIGRLRKGADLYDGIAEVLLRSGVRLGHVTGIGAVQKATIAYYDQHIGKYETIVLDEPMEIVSLTGNVSIKDGKSFAHLHVVLADAQGHSRGGHLLSGGSPVFACEVFIEEYEGPELQRESDATTGLALWPEGAVL